MTTLILVRHGQSTGNLQGLYCGQLDFPLSDKGFAQAELIGSYLKTHYQIDAIYSSDLCRAMQTAEPTARAFGLEIVSERDLREICVGEWEGHDADRILLERAEEVERWKNDLSYAPKGGESHERLRERVFRSFDKILSENDGKTVAVFAHAGTIGIVFCRCVPDREERGKLFAINDLHNASITVVRFDGDRFVDCPVLGSSEHLAELTTSTDPKAV